MDLGRANLRKVGINNLHCAVHPHHGVVWTDGKGIYLAPVQLDDHQVQNATSVKLGEFQNVTSVHWSSATDGDSCHMCVVHQSNVTVWRVSGALPKLNFKQVRKINVRPVPQGCLWNPHNDVLCLLSRHQCSFYFRHDTNKGSYAFPAMESGSIACGCWSIDGSKLVLCVGAALFIYRWSDINTAIEVFAATAWRIPGLEGKLTAISPVLKDSVVVAAEVPLESLCKQQDMFKIPDAHGDGQVSNDDVIRPIKSASATNSLLNLQHNAQAFTDSRSSLTLIHLRDGSHHPSKLSVVPLKGVLTPDILLYEKRSQCVVVGSNTQSQLHIYALLEKHLAYCGNIQLDKGQRPKGLCSMPTFFDERGAALLILVGQREAEETGLMSPSTEAEFRLSLKYIILKAGHPHHSRNSGRSDSVRESSSGHAKSSTLKSEKKKAHHVKNLSDPTIHKLSDSQKQTPQDSESQGDQITLPLSPVEEPALESEFLTKPRIDNTNNERKIIEDLSSESSCPVSLEVETAQFSSQSASFDNSKLRASYDLCSADGSRQTDETDSVCSSMLKYMIPRESFDSHENKEGMLVLGSSSQIHPQIVTEGSSKPDQISEGKRGPVTLACNIGQASDFGHSDRLAKNEPPLSQIITEVKHDSNFSISTHTEECSIENVPRSESAIKYEMLPAFSQNSDSLEHLPSLQTVVKVQTASLILKSHDLSHGDLNSQFKIKPSDVSTFSQTEEVTTLCVAVKPSETSTSSQTEEAATLYVDAKPSNISTFSQTEEATILPAGVKPSNTSTFSQTEEAAILPADVKPSNTSTFSQTEETAILRNDVKPLNTSAFSQTEEATTLCADVKPSNTSTFSQTEIATTPCADIKPKIESTSAQTETEFTDSLSSLPCEFPSRATSSLQMAEDMYTSQSNTKSTVPTVSDSPFDSIELAALSNINKGRLEISNMNNTLQACDLDQCKEDTSDLGFASSQHSMDSSWEVLEKQAKSQKDSIEALHRHLELLSTTVDKTTCVFPTRYHDMSQPEIVEIYCEKPEGTETKHFLLDNGRLQLEPVKVTFGLATVELWLDGIPCVLGANIDGYIPMKFPPSARLHITGRPADR